MLRQKEEQMASLQKELEMQRDLRETEVLDVKLSNGLLMQRFQVQRSLEEKRELMQRAEETKHILKEIEILKEQVTQPPDVTAHPKFIGRLTKCHLLTIIRSKPYQVNLEKSGWWKVFRKLFQTTQASLEPTAITLGMSSSRWRTLTRSSCLR